jgi:hypothetical protein
MILSLQTDLRKGSTMDKKDFFKSMKDDPRKMRSFLHDPVTTLNAYGVDPGTVDTSLIPKELPDALKVANIGGGTGTAIAGAASAAIG